MPGRRSPQKTRPAAEIGEQLNASTQLSELAQRQEFRQSTAESNRSRKNEHGIRKLQNHNHPITTSSNPPIRTTGPTAIWPQCVVSIRIWAIFSECVDSL